MWSTCSLIFLVMQGFCFVFFRIFTQSSDEITQLRQGHGMKHIQQDRRQLGWEQCFVCSLWSVELISVQFSSSSLFSGCLVSTFGLPGDLRSRNTDVSSRGASGGSTAPVSAASSPPPSPRWWSVSRFWSTKWAFWLQKPKEELKS